MLNDAEQMSGKISAQSPTFIVIGVHFGTQTLFMLILCVRGLV